MRRGEMGYGKTRMLLLLGYVLVLMLSIDKRVL